MTQVEKISARVRKELVLLHKEGVRHPQGTVQWLNALGWLSSYFHVMEEREGGREGGRGLQCTVLIKCIHFQVRVSDEFFSEDPSPLVSPSHMTVM